jgi:hypothetical protein
MPDSGKHNCSFRLSVSSPFITALQLTIADVNGV